MKRREFIACPMEVRTCEFVASSRIRPSVVGDSLVAVGQLVITMPSFAQSSGGIIRPAKH